MPGANDVMLARLSAELDEKRSFQESLLEDATNAGRDLTDNEMELFQRASSRMGEIEKMLDPMREAARIAYDSSRRTAELQSSFAMARGKVEKPPVEYRSTGAYLQDLLLGQHGDEEARGRIEMFNRVAHQTTADNLGLLPVSIIGPVVNRVDMARPIVSAVGPQDLGPGRWSYAKVTAHTSVATQSSEKTELASQKMTISETAITAPTWGGYVNISLQDIRRSSPSIFDVVVNDLAAQYAIQTENACADALTTGATPGTNTAIVAASTVADIVAALWVNAAAAYTAMQGSGRVFLALSPDLVGTFAKGFFPVNPTNAASTGFNAGDFSSGQLGSISGIPVVMSAGLNTNTALLINTAAVRVFEHRYGQLSVTEPSVLGTQVAYAGDFATVITDAGGVIQVDTTA